MNIFDVVRITFFSGSKRPTGARVLVGNDEDGHVSHFNASYLCGIIPNYTDSATIFLECLNAPLQGRYVSVVGADSSLLMLCEIQAFKESGRNNYSRSSKVTALLLIHHQIVWLNEPDLNRT